MNHSNTQNMLTPTGNSDIIFGWMLASCSVAIEFAHKKLMLFMPGVLLVDIQTLEVVRAAMDIFVRAGQLTFVCCGTYFAYMGYKKKIRE